eukprot:5599132-Prymnesium_polylepis.2
MEFLPTSSDKRGILCAPLRTTSIEHGGNSTSSSPGNCESISTEACVRARGDTQPTSARLVEACTLK